MRFSCSETCAKANLRTCFNLSILIESLSRSVTIVHRHSQFINGKFYKKICFFHTDFNKNIKNFYKQIEGNFYNEGLDYNFSNSWPVIVNEGEKIQAYSNIYDMGCKRVKNYKRYNKQFEFFCPLWIEKLEDSLEFIITIKCNNQNEESILAKHNICFTNNTGHKKHDKFVSYLKEHIKYVGLDKGNDNVHDRFRITDRSQGAQHFLSLILSLSLETNNKERKNEFQELVTSNNINDTIPPQKNKKIQEESALQAAQIQVL